MRKLSALPPEMLLEILSRLPTESVLECKLVCKPWRILVYHPSFSQIHLSHLADHGKFTFLILCYQLNEEKRQTFYNHEYNENHHEKYKPLHRITRFNINPPFKRYTIIGSYNGLICLSASYDRAPSVYQPAYICNPITKEYIILPEFNRVRYPTAYYNHGGFGYLCETNEYKVLRIVQLWGKSNPECVDVYTLGSSNGWRNVGELPSYVCNFINHGVFLSGTLYWITSTGKIVAFNMADERFYELQTLPSHKSCSFGIRVLGGYLWCSARNILTKMTYVWVLKKRGKKGNQNVMEHEEHVSWT
ncbi:putative F-box protein At1g60370 [Papaver somniferum]|uniref:putative F-box protein At1g60370 n=1 Tax=Papaver somniferum TaxID=3469 RepID=UPI000E700A6A|nr:putative F-box protein At1g60370 [Papaver somniferum]